MEQTARQERLIARVGQPEGGPLLIALGSIHGNEPAGSQALEQVAAALREGGPALRGCFVALRGNLAALAEQRRFLDTDLNRAWTPERLERLRGPVAHQPVDAEAVEQQELLKIIDGLLAAADQPVFFLDLHTSSGDGPPFATVGDTLRNRRFALRLPLTLVLGIEEQIDGSLLEYINNQGHTTLGFEGGQHDDPQSVERHQALVWLALEAAGMLKPEAVPQRQRWQAALEEPLARQPRVVEVRYRHHLEPGDAFQMRPGWQSFQPIKAGELLARDQAGDIRAREAGMVLLPLYQGLGEDGFFIGRPVARFWLTVSALCRWLRLDRLVHWLPGVRRVPGDQTTVLVDKRVARWWAVEIFHLLGFRKERATACELRFQRRRE